MTRSERQEQDDGGGDQADELAGAGLGLLEREEQVAAHLEPQRRTRSGLHAERLEVLQVVRAQLLEHRIADADERDATVCGHRPTPYRHLRSRREHAGRIARAEDVRERGDARLDVGQRGPRVSRVEERRALVAWRHDQLGGEPGLIRPGGSQQLGRLVGVDARCLERVLELPAEGARRADHEHGHDEPGPDHGPWPAGAEAAESVQEVRHLVCLLRSSVDALRGPAPVERDGTGRRAPSGRRLDFPRPIGRSATRTCGRYRRAPGFRTLAR